MAKAKELNKVSFCDFCENYLPTVDAFTGVMCDETECITCADCIDEMMLIGELLSVERCI